MVNTIPGQWEAQASMPTRNHDMKCFEHGGKLLAISGFNREENFATVEEYDPDTGVWHRKREPIPTPRGLYGGATLSGRMYVIGGQRLHDDFLANRSSLKYEVFDKTECYDPSRDQWETLPPFSHRRAGLGAATCDGVVYAVGGMLCDDVDTFPKEDNITDLVEVYDPTTETWEQGPFLPAPRMCPTVESVDGRLYVIGGYHDGQFVDDVFIYDSATSEWSEAPPLHVPRRDGPSVTHNGQIYVFGGLTNGDDGNGYTDTCEMYAPSEEEWMMLPRLPRAKAWSGAGAIENRFFVVGGAHRSGGKYEFLDEVHELILEV